MTTGVPIYLVSACTTGEEFVAAFRRYADRGSVFVPIADPIPSGRRGRFALTLSTGAVMVEGEGEVISSARTPSVLHGRVGMTIRFGELDDHSKTVLIELEKARLVAKPAAPSVPPRTTAELPAVPRPVPPAPSVRVDAGATLAETVAIGDLDQLVSAAPPKPVVGPKFVMPAVLPVGAPRPKSPSTPPEGRPKTPTTPPAASRPKAPSIPPAMPALAPKPAAAKTGPSPVVPPSATSATPTAAKVPPGPDSDTMVATTPPVDRSIGGFSTTMPAVAITDLKPPPRVALDTALANAGREIAAPQTTTMEAPPAVQIPGAHPAQIMQAVSITPTGMTAVSPSLTPTGMAAVSPSLTPTGMAVVPPPTTPTELAAPRPPNPTKPLATVARPTREDPTSPTPIRVATAARREDPTPPPVARTTSPGTPPIKRPTPPPMPLTPAPPIVRDAPPRPPIVADDEKTDLTSVPIVPDEVSETTTMPAPQPPATKPGRDRRTVLGIAVTPGGLPVSPAISASAPDASLPVATKPELVPAVTAPDAAHDLDVPVEVEDTDPPQPPPAVTPAALAAKPPTVEEATPSGDWTMTPGADGPTIEPARKPEPEPPKPRMTGDWTIQLDSGSPDGWSEPSKPNIPRPELPVVVKMEKPAKPKPESPPELAARSASIIVDSVKEAEAAAARALSEEPKIQIDPTLMDAPIVTPDPPTPASASASGAFAAAPGRLATPIPGSLTAPPRGLDSMIPSGQMSVPTDVPMPTPVPGVPPPVVLAPSPAELAAMTPAPPPQHRVLTDGGVGFFRDSGEIANLAGTGAYATGDSTSLLEVQRRRRIVVIAVSAGLVVAIGIVLVIAFAGGGGNGKKDEPIVNPPALDAGAGSAKDRVVITPVDAGAAELPAPADAAIVAPPAECFVDVATVPAGAEVVLGRAVLGTTPAKLSLPCGAEVRLVVRKLRFVNVLRQVTPTEHGATVRIALQKLMFSVKLSSQPAGAAIALNGKPTAVTPTTMKVPAFELSTITFTKDGFAPQTFKVKPKQNNQTVHAQLKRRRR